MVQMVVNVKYDMTAMVMLKDTLIILVIVVIAVAVCTVMVITTVISIIHYKIKQI